MITLVSILMVIMVYYINGNDVDNVVLMVVSINAIYQAGDN